MPRPLLFFGAFLGCCAPLLAQQTSTEKPKEFQFQFNFNMRKDAQNGRHRAEIETGLARLIGAKTIPFDRAISSVGGFPVRETVTFLDGDGKVLGTLETSFGRAGQVQKQALKVGKNAPRALSWFKTMAVSPILEVPGSVVRARFRRAGATLSGRELWVKTSTQTRLLETRYDATGRRQSDRAQSGPSPLSLLYFYGPLGLSRLQVAASPDEKLREVSVGYSKTGALDEILIRQGGVLVSRMVPQWKDSEMVSQRMESFKDGVLDSALTLEGQSKRAIQEEYDDAGLLFQREIFSLEANGARLLRTRENFEAGKIQRRDEFDEKGVWLRQIELNADGTVKKTHDIAPSASPQAPASDAPK